MQKLCIYCMSYKLYNFSPEKYVTIIYCVTDPRAQELGRQSVCMVHCIWEGLDLSRGEAMCLHFPSDLSCLSELSKGKLCISIPQIYFSK